MAPVRTTSADGQPLALHHLGAGDRPVLLAHATGFNAGVWGPLAAELGDGFDRWALDFRAHGASTRVPGASLHWDAFAGDVLAAVDHLLADGVAAPGQLLGVGHSMGGAALVLAEALRPGTFAGLWLFEPVVFPRDALGGGEGGNRLADGARRRRDAFASRAEAQANYAAKPPLNVLRADALAAYVDHGLAEGDDGQVHLTCRPEDEAAIFEGGGAHDAFARLGEVRCPVVVARGRDGFGPVAVAGAVAEALPAGRLEAHLHLGHFGPLEAPAELAVSVAELAATC